MKKTIAILILLLSFPLVVLAPPSLSSRSAQVMRIKDSGGFYTANQVEGALQEIGNGTTLDGRYVNLDGETTDITNGTFNLTTTGKIAIRSDANYLDLGATADDYKIQWDGSDAVHTISAGDFVFTGGKFGINEVAPASSLHITMPLNGDGIRLERTGNATGVWELRTQNIVGSDADFLIKDITNNRVGFLINKSNGYMRAGGGSTTPQAPMHITDNVSTLNAIATVTIFGLNGTSAPSNDFGPGILFQGQTSTTPDSDMARISSIWEDVTHATRSAAITFETVDSAGALTERMRISSDGNVGIPNDTGLFFSGVAETTDYTWGWNGNNAVHTIIAGDFVFAGGNVGINTTSPDTKFQVVGDLKVGDDNTNYVEIGTTGDQVFVGGAGLPYGEINVVSNAAETVIASQNVYVQVTIFDTNGVSNNSTPDHTNDHITITKAGVYLITCSVTLDSVGGAGSTAEMEVQKNNGTARVGALHVDRTLSGGGAESSAETMTGMASLSVNDTIEVWIKNETNTQNYIVEDITLSLVQIGG